MVGWKTGDRLLGEAIDLINPLSDLQDLVDFLDWRSQRMGGGDLDVLDGLLFATP
jgi:hypothetical protein